MQNIFRGRKIRLRQFTESDADLLIDKNGDFDTETAQKYDIIDFPYSINALRKKISDLNSLSPNTDDFCFAIEKLDGTKVGVITAFDCNARMGTFKYGQFILQQHQMCGYGSEAARILLNYYFNELRYHKSNVYIYEFNDASIKFHERLGFKKEGQLKDMVYTNGSYYDIVFLGMTDSEFIQYRRSSL